MLNFNDMLKSEKVAERAIEKLSENLIPFTTPAVDGICNRITPDMIQIMSAFMANKYHIPIEISMLIPEELIDFTFRAMALGYAMALFDASEKGHES